MIARAVMGFRILALAMAVASIVLFGVSSIGVVSRQALSLYRPDLGGPVCSVVGFQFVIWKKNTTLSFVDITPVAISRKRGRTLAAYQVDYERWTTECESTADGVCWNGEAMIPPEQLFGGFHCSDVDDATRSPAGVSTRWGSISIITVSSLGLAVAVSFEGCGRVLRRRRALSNHCTHCGYNLMGNVTGICPECGQARDVSSSLSDNAGRRLAEVH